MEIQIKLEEEIDVESFIEYVEAYFQLTPQDEQKGVRGLYEDFNKQTYNRQTTSRQDSFCMSICEHSNCLDSTNEFKCNKKNKTTASATIIFLFIFLSKPKIILANPAKLQSYGNQLTFNESSECN